MKKENLIILIFFNFLVSCGANEKKTDKSKESVALITKENIEKGEQLFRAKCMNCHMKNGEGLPNYYPPLAKSDFLKKNKAEAIKMVKFGSNKSIKVRGQKYNGVMPASGLSDEELVLVFNYILNSWGNDFGEVSLELVKSIHP